MFLRLFKSELFRASKLKSTYILIIVLFVISMFLNLVTLKFDFLGAYGMDSEQYIRLAEGGNSMEGVNDAAQVGTIMGESMVTSNTEEVKILGEGLFYSADIPTLFQIHVSDLDPIMLLAIFVGIFAGDIISTGVNKNLVISNNKRNLLFAARATVIAIYAVIIHIFTWLFTLFGAAIWAEKVDLGWSQHAVGYWFVSLLLTIVFAILIYAITVLTKSKAAGITIGVVLSTGALSLIISIADWAIKKKLDVKSDFSVANYLLTENLGSLRVDYTNTALIRALVVAALYTVVGIVVVAVINKKRDLA